MLAYTGLTRAHCWNSSQSCSPNNLDVLHKLVLESYHIAPLTMVSLCQIFRTGVEDSQDSYIWPEQG